VREVQQLQDIASSHQAVTITRPTTAQLHRLCQRNGRALNLLKYVSVNKNSKNKKQSKQTKLKIILKQ